MAPLTNIFIFNNNSKVKVIFLFVSSTCWDKFTEATLLELLGPREKHRWNQQSPLRSFIGSYFQGISQKHRPWFSLPNIGGKASWQQGHGLTKCPAVPPDSQIHKQIHYPIRQVPFPSPSQGWANANPIPETFPPDKYFEPFLLCLGFSRLWFYSSLNGLPRWLKQ